MRDASDDERPAMELGLYTFAELTPTAAGGTIAPAQRLRDLVEEIELAHGLDVNFGHDRFLMQLTVGTLPHDEVMRAIELFGTEVARSCVARSPPGGSRPRRSGRVGSGTLGGRGTDDRGDPP
jgi:hypothetical protein